MEEIQELIKLFEGVVPERIDEIKSLIQSNSVQFRRIGDKPGFTLSAGAFGVIQFTQRSLEQLWIFGFSGKLALHCYSGIMILAKTQSLKFDLDKIGVLEDQLEEDERFRKLIETILHLNNADSECDFNWPDSIPKPENRKPIDIEDAAVFDLILMATAYVFLHELKHVIFEADGNTPAEGVDEEMQCDAFASHMMLDQIEKYCKISGYPEQQVRMKRAAGIALGNAFLAVATPKSNLGGSRSHPPVHQRWQASLTNVELTGDDFYWLYFASLATALLKYHKIGFPPQDVLSFKELAISAIRALENST